MRRPGAPPKPAKYGNKKCVIDGFTFDSQAEGWRYRTLKARLEKGEIADLELQVPFVLVPGVKFLGAKRATPALRYVADFRYTDFARGEVVIEDVKGMKTAVYRIKKHLMKVLLGLEITER